jgi:hypothetical protein
MLLFRKRRTTTTRCVAAAAACCGRLVLRLPLRAPGVIRPRLLLLLLLLPQDFGGKWDLRQIKLHVMSRHGVAKADKLFADIQAVIMRALLAVQNIMISDKHCFELYGYDMLFDDTLKPWLFEVNASPSVRGGISSWRHRRCCWCCCCFEV